MIDRKRTSPEAVGLRLQIVRNKIKSDKKFGELIGIISDSNIWRYTRGEILFPLDRALYLYDETKVSLNYLYLGDESQGIFLSGEQIENNYGEEDDFDRTLDRLIAYVKVAPVTLRLGMVSKVFLALSKSCEGK